MFKNLFAWVERGPVGEEKGNDPALPPDVQLFFDRLDRFAFYNDLKKVLADQGKNLSRLRKDRRHMEILSFLLYNPGLKYGSLPKGLILFHSYPDKNRTAFEEHLVEGSMHMGSNNRTIPIHFTVSPEHMKKFKSKMKEVRSYYEKLSGIHYHVTYSVQKPSTDTIAVTPDNQPFRLQDGGFLFRPGGHGALIENLNELQQDIIFIKNIDNVVPDRLKEEPIQYKKLLGGILIDILEKIYYWLKLMDYRILSEEETDQLTVFATDVLLLDFSEDTHSLSPKEKQQYLYGMLHRPLRVCGMVKNEGEPGGGPFWVAGKDGRLTLQIIESAQINMDDSVYKQVVYRSTHFNPVDLVCAIKDHKGHKFDLRLFVDPDTYFISEKSYDGKELKALELPGLWNGSMARWITLFIQVPATTFHPVKTVNDLLRPEHQGV